MRSFSSLVIAFCFAVSGARAAELRVRTDFPGGSATIESIDQAAKSIQLTPGGDPQRGWPCWWYACIEGLTKDERAVVSVGASKLPARNNGKDTGKPLAANWSTPNRASYSTDGKVWMHTVPGGRSGDRMTYEITGTGDPIWIAWGPPFVPSSTEQLINDAEKSMPEAKGFELARTRENRPVRALRIGDEKRRRAIWVQARQHAWESGASWVARGFTEWIASDDADARWLREQAEIVIVPIVDVDNVATGNGGKEASPRDHNRDWDATPVYPEVSAAQKQLKAWACAGRLDVFLDLHNPSAGDSRPFFFAGPEELLTEEGRKNRAAFLQIAERRIAEPLPVEAKPRLTGPAYHPLWRQISGQWVNANGNPHTLALCLETSWNTPHSTTAGYLTVGEQLAQTVADFLRRRAKPEDDSAQ
jgi:hypothetical protein